MRSQLHRDDPTKEPLAGNIKVTKQDWLNVGIEIFVNDGIEQVKVMTLAEQLGVSRSSFYWYFEGRQGLLENLLEHWLTLNTGAIESHAKMPAQTITAATCNLFLCFVDPVLFDTKLDFAVRDWARRSAKIRKVLDTSDARRIAAISAMYSQFDFSDIESLTRAKVLYYMQIGYNDADLQESVADRMKMMPHYIFAFTGHEATEAELDVVRQKLQTMGAVL